jgi:UDP-3-O-[3-hydroxymyristoyl] glucosamine N-acyltransferase
LDFQTYPDTWLRDLPLLEIGKGAYLSNKATISPNMCLRNGKIIVQPVRIGAGTMIGHSTMIAPGVTIGDESEIGVGCAVGLNVKVGCRTVIDHTVSLDHGSVIGNRCVIGSRVYIGRSVVVKDGMRIPAGAVVKARTAVATQDQADALANEASRVSRRDSAETLRASQHSTDAASSVRCSPWLVEPKLETNPVPMVSDCLGTAEG